MTTRQIVMWRGFVLSVNSAFFVQLLGLVAGATCSCCFFAKTDRQLRLSIILGVSLYAIHFYLLRAPVASATEAVNVLWQVISIASARLGRFTRYAIWLLGCVVYVIAGVIFWTGWVSLLPVVASIWTASVLFLLTNHRLRYSLLVADALWFTNGVFTGSYGGVLFSALSMTLNASILFRRRTQRRQLVAEPYSAWVRSGVVPGGRTTRRYTC